jgi:GntR family histidine utilization transcriptional repressor
MVYPDRHPSNQSTRAGDLASTIAPYVQIKEFLKKGLSMGQWHPGELLPSDAALGARFKMSRMTVIRALRELQSEGLVHRKSGLGTYAAHLTRVASTLTISDLHEEITSRGRQHRVKVLLSAQEATPKALTSQLGIQEGAPVFHTQILHFENDIPLQFEDRYVNPECAPGYLENDFCKSTPTQYLLKVAPLWEAQYSIESGIPTEQEAAQLRIAPREPCLIVVRRTTNLNVPITLVRMVHPGARYRLQGAFKP